METFHIIHTNDFHSHFEYLPAVKRIILEKRENYQRDHESYLLIDDGDNLDRSHPLTEATMGVANVNYLNDLHFDAVTIGNNEGLGMNPAELTRIYQKSHFKIIEGNVFEKNTKKLPNFARRDYIFRIGNLKIGIFGYTAFFNSYLFNGWNAVSYEQLIASEVEKLRPQVDVLILLSHLGIKVDESIADQCPLIDVIIGSHTHHLLPHGEIRNGVLLAAAGKFFENTGFIDLTLENRRILKKSAYTVPSEVLPKDILQNDILSKKGDQIMEQELVIENSPGFGFSNFEKSDLSELFVLALRNYTGCKYVILNAGLFLNGLPKGKVTYREVFHALPHPIHPIIVKLTGVQLRSFITEIENTRNFLTKYPLKGVSFRGRIFGSMLYYGIEVDGSNAFFNHRKIVDDQVYSIVVPDNFRYLKYFPSIEQASKIKPFYGKFLREVLRDYLKNSYGRK
ncbi:bifunctional metallophosphatase/5'-nucleotidase [Xylocopilactobacillus apicola]|uniref:Multifunctional 2',3'-cyclic-nucleotide 2'-phosphodiesterase/5'-nucleotidase/3'-nucleotidase n=1 Tax=Xylocopilactobacillus apicola TaxID=2932184 RepID=A0AAU9CWS6_9LACO|nr:metallophosphoesterase [Xylocopilactobacillus apicola]BDR58424.1 multifunctional 2',3'-cyclic-nucleotide 2'-phosphodiesterase/5'-nucleotidase/3'-nucleotidase [Xylocopilactobacillus apicola]